MKSRASGGRMKYLSNRPAPRNYIFHKQTRSKIYIKYMAHRVFLDYI